MLGEGDIIAAVSGGVCYRLQIGTIEFDAVNMTFDWGALGGDEVNDVVFEINTRRCIHYFPFTLGEEDRAFGVQR